MNAPLLHLYEAKFHEVVGPAQSMACRSYDALMLFAGAAAECGWSDTTCLSKALLETKSYQGASGKLSFDQAGDSILSFSLQAIRQGAFVSAS